MAAGRWRRENKAKAAIEVITGSDAAKPAIPGSAGPIIFNPNPENLSYQGKSKFKSGHRGDHRLWRGVER
jgi:hypothetical protein